MVYGRFGKRSALATMSRRATSSPGRHSLMGEVLRLVAEPGSFYANPKKKPESSGFPKNGKLTNHDYCDMCSGGGEIVCCDKCPKSYHIKCHSPSINKLPDGEWLCSECAYIENGEMKSECPTVDNNDGDIKSLIGKIFNKEEPNSLGDKEFLSEVPIQRKYNVKLPPRKQLDKAKLIRKKDRCAVCNKGILRARLQQCSYCFRMYHLNCLDPPIRDWDHSMKFECPIHNKFYEMVYPTIFTPDCGIRSDAVTMKRQRCELVNRPVNTCFNVPSHIDAMYKEPEENIPIAEKSSLNILCDVASFALESINSNHSINSDNKVSNDISAKFLARQRINKSPKNKCPLPKLPTASLTCLSVPFNFSICKSSFTIGKHLNCDLCLLPYGDCQYISDQHVTITFDSKLGDFLVKNHSMYGIIVDNVSYFGNHRPKEPSTRELKVINSQIKKHINKRRRTIYNRKLLNIFKSPMSEKLIMKYAHKKRKFDYHHMYKYYSKKFKNIKHNYQRIQCKCSKIMNILPTDGYCGQAVLRNKSIVSIGCMKFMFSYDAEEVPKKCAVKVPKVCTKKIPKACTAEAPEICEGIVSNAFVEESHSEEVPQIGVKHVYVEEQQSDTSAEVPEMCADDVLEIYDSDEIHEVLMEDISNATEDGLVAVLTGDRTSIVPDQTQNGGHRSCLSEITASLTSLIKRCDSFEEQNLLKQVYLDNPSDCEFSDSHLEISCVPNHMELEKDNNSTQTSDNDSNLIFNDCGDLILENDDGPSLNDNIDPTLNISGDPTLNICSDPTLNDGQISGPVGLESCGMDVLNGVESCYVDDLVQEIEEPFSDSCEIVEEEVLFEWTYTEPPERVDDNIQNWIEEIDVEVPDPQAQLQDNNNVNGNIKTEHMYCARSPSNGSPSIIVISSDDDE